MIDYEKLLQEIIQYRRDLHQIPELGFYVYKTCAYVCNVLAPLDCTVEKILQTGVVAYFDFGKEETLAFRADMDGLPITEETGLPYASVHEGCMHACGHDGHMASLLGFAKILDDYKKSHAEVKYNAMLLFQPAEETIDGALKICGTGIFDKYNIKAIYGLHLWPMLQAGEIASRPGPMMAKSTAVNITFEGLSAHCGDPDKGKDALEAACRFVSDIYTFKSLYVKDRSVLKFGKMESGTVRNAISPYTVLNGTMRTFQEKTWDTLVDAMTNLGEEIESHYGTKFTLDVSQSHPAVVNHEELYTKVKPALMDLNYVELARPVMIAEDFSFFEKEMPGIFFFLGTGTNIPLHADTYDIDESILIEGPKLFNTLFKEAI